MTIQEARERCKRLNREQLIECVSVLVNDRDETDRFFDFLGVPRTDPEKGFTLSLYGRLIEFDAMKDTAQ